MANVTVQPLVATQTGGAQQINLVAAANRSDVQILVVTHVNESQTVNLPAV